MEAEIDYGNLKLFKGNETGNLGLNEKFKIKEIPFNNYLIKIKLTSDDKFVEIVEIGYNKEFLSISQKCRVKGYHDVDQFYIE